MNGHFSKEDTKIANEHVNILSLVIRETQVKTIMRYHSHPLGWVYFLKREKITGVGKDVAKLEPSHTAGRNGKR